MRRVVFHWLDDTGLWTGCGLMPRWDGATPAMNGAAMREMLAANALFDVCLPCLERFAEHSEQAGGTDHEDRQS